MKRSTKLSLVISGIALFLAGAYSYSAFHSFSPQGIALVTLQNRTDEVISSANISYNGRTYLAGKIEPHDEAQVPFRVTRKGGYVVSAVFSSGEKLSSKELGYLTNDIYFTDVIFKDVIVIGNDDIVFDGRLSEAQSFD